MCNYVLGWSLDNRSILFGYIQKEQMESKMTGDGFWLEKELANHLKSSCLWMILRFFGFSCFFFLAPTEPLGGLEMWWSETHVVSQLAAVGRTVAGAVGRCWDLCPSWSASPSIRYCMT